VVSHESIWYVPVLLFFSASANIDTGLKSSDCALASTLEICDDPEMGDYCHYFSLWSLILLICIMAFILIIFFIFFILI
jgi:hypothetical protein